MVKAADTSPLVVINQLSPVYVSFSVPGRFLADIRRYQAQAPLQVSVTAPTGLAVAGRGPLPAAGAALLGPTGRPPAAAIGVLSFIDNAVDPTTGTIKLKATFPNTDHQLWPGAFVQVTLQLATHLTALVVPSTAVQTSQEGQYVYLVKPDSTVELRPVRVDQQRGEETVIAEGVAAGDVVVTDGHLRLVPGAAVSERDRGTGGGPGTRGTTEGGRGR